VDEALLHPDHTRALATGDMILMSTDGLVEHPRRSLDACLDELAALASAHNAPPLDDLCRLPADRHPSDGHDDLAVRPPPPR